MRMAAEWHSWQPPGGTALGQWTDEVKAGETILEFASGGPKLYTYFVQRADGSQYAVRKCKGIRLTPEILASGRELDQVLLHGGSLQLPQTQFKRDKPTCTISTVSMAKTFQRVLTKRMYTGDCSMPYGFRPEN